MNTSTRIAFTCAAILATAHSLHAEFLVLKVRETTAESIWHWVAALLAVLVFFTMRASRNKGGQGR